MARAEQITDAIAQHGEGPVWFPAWNGVCWVDLLAGDILRLGPDGAIDRWPVGTVAAAFRPRRQGGVVVATERGFALADEWGGDLTPLDRVFDDDTIRFNEGDCDPDGNFFVGTMAYDETPGRGTVYRLGRDHDVRVALAGVSISNGLAWTADGTGALYIDTPTQRIDRFDFDAERGLHHRRPFAVVDPADGAPDGLCLDAQDGVWVALWGGAAVRHYTADGHLAGVVELPLRKITACTFGGPDLDQLFITTSREGETAPAAGAGALFRADVGVVGAPVRSYGG